MVGNLCCNNRILAVNHLWWQGKWRHLRYCVPYKNAFIKMILFKIKVRTLSPCLPTTSVPSTLNHLGIAKNSLAGTAQSVDCSRLSWVFLSIKLYLKVLQKLFFSPLKYISMTRNYLLIPVLETYGWTWNIWILLKVRNNPQVL